MSDCYNHAGNTAMCLLPRMNLHFPFTAVALVHFPRNEQMPISHDKTAVAVTVNK